MPKLERRLQDYRDPYILMMYNDSITAQDIANIFDLSLSAVWRIIKLQQEIVDKNN